MVAKRLSGPYPSRAEKSTQTPGAALVGGAQEAARAAAVGGKFLEIGLPFLDDAKGHWVICTLLVYASALSS